MLLIKTTGTSIFFEKVGDKVQIIAQNLQPTSAFFKGKGKKDIQTDYFEITVPIDFVVHMFLSVKTIEEGFVPTFYQTEENNESKKIIIFKGEKNKEGFLGIKMINYTREEGGVIWIPKGGHIKRIRLLSVIEEVLKQFPILLYKEQDLNIVWQSKNRRLIITDDTGEWLELFNPINLNIFRELVWVFDKTGELPTTIDFIPGVEKREYRMLGIDEEGNFIVLGRVYPLALFKRIGYLISLPFEG